MIQQLGQQLREQKSSYENRSTGRDRTYDQLVNSQLLYR